MSEYNLTSNLNIEKIKTKTTIGDTDVISSESGNPNPVEYLIASINSCISISAGMIARVHNLPLSKFEIENHAETAPVPNSKTKIITKMNLTVTIEGIPEKDKQDFLNHALHVSTVYRTLENSISIEVKLAN